MAETASAKKTLPQDLSIHAAPGAPAGDSAAIDDDAHLLAVLLYVHKAHTVHEGAKLFLHVHARGCAVLNDVDVQDAGECHLEFRVLYAVTGGPEVCLQQGRPIRQPYVGVFRTVDGACARAVDRDSLRRARCRPIRSPGSVDVGSSWVTALLAATTSTTTDAAARGLELVIQAPSSVRRPCPLGSPP